MSVVVFIYLLFKHVQLFCAFTDTLVFEMQHEVFIQSLFQPYPRVGYLLKHSVSVWFLKISRTILLVWQCQNRNRFLQNRNMLRSRKLWGKLSDGCSERVQCCWIFFDKNYVWCGCSALVASCWSNIINDARIFVSVSRRGCACGLLLSCSVPRSLSFSWKWKRLSFSWKWKCLTSMNTIFQWKHTAASNRDNTQTLLSESNRWSNEQ